MRLSRAWQDRVWIGTSGYVYKHWRGGVFYPKGLPQDEELEFYSRQFRTVELNNPFYRLPKRQAFVHWRKRTPADFLFAVKASRYITHIKRLKDARQPLRTFLRHAGGLNEKLGPILFQFPAFWQLNLERLQSFLKLLPSGEFAFEFRHPTWLVEPVFKALRRARVALCLPVAPGMPIATSVVTAEFTYIRMHAGSGAGGGFTSGELAAWAKKIQKLLSLCDRVYVYFNNDAHGFAVKNAIHLRRLLGGSLRRSAAP